MYLFSFGDILVSSRHETLSGSCMTCIIARKHAECFRHLRPLLLKDDVRDLLSKDHTKRLELRERPDTGVYVQVHVQCVRVCLALIHKSELPHEICKHVWVSMFCGNYVCIYIRKYVTHFS